MTADLHSSMYALALFSFSACNNSCWRRLYSAASTCKPGATHLEIKATWYNPQKKSYYTLGVSTSYRSGWHRPCDSNLSDCTNEWHILNIFSKQLTGSQRTVNKTVQVQTRDSSFHRWKHKTEERDQVIQKLCVWYIPILPDNDVRRESLCSEWYWLHPGTMVGAKKLYFRKPEGKINNNFWRFGQDKMDTNFHMYTILLARSKLWRLLEALERWSRSIGSSWQKISKRMSTGISFRCPRSLFTLLWFVWSWAGVLSSPVLREIFCFFRGCGTEDWADGVAPAFEMWRAYSRVVIPRNKESGRKRTIFRPMYQKTRVYCGCTAAVLIVTASDHELTNSLQLTRTREEHQSFCKIIFAFAWHNKMCPIPIQTLVKADQAPPRLTSNFPSPCSKYKKLRVDYPDTIF